MSTAAVWRESDISLMRLKHCTLDTRCARGMCVCAYCAV